MSDIIDSTAPSDTDLLANGADAIRDTRAAINTVNADLLARFPIGASLEWSGHTIPTGFMQENGAALSRTTYADLYAVLTVSKGTFTVTIATPGLFTLNSHGLATGDCIELTTTGALPTGISANTNYYVVYNDANSFWLATTYEYATAALPTKIATTGTQSGTHSLRYTPWGISTSSNFLLPDTRGVHIEGVGQHGTASWASAQYIGNLGQYKQDTLQEHYHTGQTKSHGGGNWGFAGDRSTNLGTDTTIILTMYTDGTHGTPRGDYKTAPARVGKYRIIKVA